ncbi:MAG: DNA polymerase III subunit gamma/tau [Alphaproteobacteria bacterium]|nr:DNA polymerase III subunit gamma/tau [Alphaproteobacteria bacterium]
MSDTENPQNAASEEAYRVLARKYRPQNFDDLIGQDALVRTLKNAIESGRIAHAFMLTGIRGVGKTTTARIIAKALNYTGADGQSGPTTDATDDCEVCKAIAEDRHPDVMEMDAASRTGVDDIREILDGVRYAPTSARYKVYIIDEVHMLSKAAFNALLKTLEEPPEHVKFIFATTEIRKVPITVLSRCQRFDLRRIEAEELARYYGEITEKENAKIEDEALSLIARAADGSVRDGLSLLDQSIALGDKNVTAIQVKDMLGLADRGRILDLLEAGLKGESQESLDVMDGLYRDGADPVVVLQDMLDFTHALTKLKALPQLTETQLAVTKDERERLSSMSGSLSMPTLGRTWQLLLKGLGEVKSAPHPQKAAEMIVLRLLYASNLPDPTELVKKIKDEPAGAATASNTNAPTPVAAQTSAQAIGVTEIPMQAMQAGGAPVQAAPQETETPVANLGTLEGITQALEDNKMMILAGQVSHYVHLVKLEDQLLEFMPAENAPQKLAQELTQALKQISKERWVVTVSAKQGQPTLAQQAEVADQEKRAKLKQEPLIDNILSMFPGSDIKKIHTKS